MKNHIILMIVLALFGSLSACTKKKAEVAPVVKPSENPLAKILENYNSKFTESLNDKGAEFGYLFSPITDGKITQLGCRMPETGQYTVTLWEENNSAKPIRQKIVEQTAPGKEVLANIEELAVQKDKKYIVSVNTISNNSVKKFYGLFGPDPILFPKVHGNILFLEPMFKVEISKSTYPSDSDKLVKLFLLGLADFTFIPN